MNFPGHLMGNLLCKNGLRYRRGRLFQKVHRNTGIGKVLLSVGNGLGGQCLERHNGQTIRCAGPDDQCSGEGVDEIGQVLGGGVWVVRCFTALS